jgi:hypothetical protein
VPVLNLLYLVRTSASVALNKAVKVNRPQPNESTEGGI